MHNVRGTQEMDSSEHLCITNHAEHADKPVGAALRSGVAAVAQVQVKQQYGPKQCSQLTIY